MAVTYTSTMLYPTAGDASLSSAVSTYYAKRSQDRLLSNLVYYSLAEKKNLPKNSGQYMQFYRYDQVSGTGSLTTALKEDAISANSAALSARIMTLSAQVYGAHIVLSKFASDTFRSGQLIEDTVDVLTDTASEIVDTLVRTTLSANASAVYGTDLSKTSATILTSDTFSEVTIRKAIADLRTNKVRPFVEGQMYPVVLTPKQVYDLTSSTSVGGWAAAASYSDPQKIWTGQIATLHGARILMSQNNNTTFATSVLTSTVTGNAAEAYMVGAGALACASIESNPVSVIVKNGDSNSTYDAFNNRMSVAVKLNGFGVVWLDDAVNRARRIITATSA